MIFRVGREYSGLRRPALEGIDPENRSVLETDLAMATLVLVSGIGDSALGFRGSLARELVARGHRVTVSVPKPTEVRPETVVEGFRALGAECVFAPLDRTGTNPLRELAVRRHYGELFARLRPDGVFAANPKPVFHAIPAAAAAGVRRRVAMVTGLGHVFTDKGLRARLLRRIAAWLYRRAFREATTVFFQNPDDRDELGALGAVPRGADLRFCRGSGVDLAHHRESKPPGGAPVFLMISRLLAEKGVREFAEAARLVRAGGTACRFRLAGWIDTNPSAIPRKELDRWIRDGTIEYAGRLDDVRDELAAASVFVLPSYREGTPRSVLEAMAAGRPVVTTDVPGCRETVLDGVSGLIVPARDARALAEACSELAGDRARREQMGRAARARAESEFDVRAVNAAIIEALDA